MTVADKTKVSFYVPTPLARAIRLVAAREERSQSELASEALEAYLLEQQDHVHDVIVAAISGRMSGNPRRFDHPIMAWEGAGLLMPSVVRCAKLVTLERSTVHRDPRPAGSQ
jgi:hypothetical protein